MTTTRHQVHHAGHPRTESANHVCRRLKLCERPTFGPPGDTRYLVQAFDARGRWLDLNGTEQGEPHFAGSPAEAVWVTGNLRWGVLHEWDAERHTLRRVAKIHLYATSRCRTDLSPSGWAMSGTAEVHTVNPDGTTTVTRERPRL